MRPHILTPLNPHELADTSAPADPASVWVPIVPVPDDASRTLPQHCHGKPSSRWVYRDGNGKPLGLILRFDMAEGGKEFCPLVYCRHANGREEWRWKGFPVPRPLYGLDRLAASPDAPVLLVEGEKAADAATALFPDHVAITSAGGSNGARKADWTPLRGRAVTIWPDADEPGRAYAIDAARLSTETGAVSVRIVNLPEGLPQGWDLADPLPDALADFDCLSALEGAPCFADASGAERRSQAHVELLSAADIQPEAIRWLWEGYLARGKLHILAGAPGTGKTTLALSLAATITNGGRWPDGSRCEAGHVVMWTGEDDPKDTIAPRLLACGANLKRFSFVTGFRDEGVARSFDPSADMKALAETLGALGNVKLLIVDPVVSAVAGDSHKNAEVRQGLQPLVDLGVQLDCAILGISHFSKGSAGRAPTERVTGSLAFGAVARMVFAAAKREEDAEGGGRMFVRAKSNIARDAGGFAYDLEQVTLEDHPDIQASRVRWGAFLEGEAKDLLAEAEADNPDEMEERREGMAWLRDRLASGPVAAKDLQREAQRQGISPKSLRTIRTRLGVVTRKDGFDEGWVWELPPLEDAHSSPKMPQDAQDAQDAQTPGLGTLGTFDGNGRLRSAWEVEI